MVENEGLYIGSLRKELELHSRFKDLDFKADQRDSGDGLYASRQIGGICGVGHKSEMASQRLEPVFFLVGRVIVL